MYIKNAIILFFLILSTSVFAQIQIDDVGDGWKSKVDSALQLIKNKSPEKYKQVEENCTKITFWLGDRSTTQAPSTIVIARKDIQLNSINNLACIIVHESHHLWILKNKIAMSKDKEELECYQYEYEFLNLIPEPESWLTIYVIKSIMTYKEKLK